MPDGFNFFDPTPEERRAAREMGLGETDIAGRPQQSGFAPTERIDGDGFFSKSRSQAIRMDAALLRRAGISREQAMRMAQFADTRGGLDAFENIAAARRAFTESGAFTDLAGTAAAPEIQSEVVSERAGIDTKTGAADLTGLPLIIRKV